MNKHPFKLFIFVFSLVFLASFSYSNVGYDLSNNELTPNIGYDLNNDKRTLVEQIFITNISTNGTSPGGSNTEIQFNDGGVFGGNNNFTWNNSESSLCIGCPTLTHGVEAPIHIQDGKILFSTLVAGTGSKVAGRRFATSSSSTEENYIQFDSGGIDLHTGSWAGTDFRITGQGTFQQNLPLMTFGALNPVIYASLSSSSDLGLKANDIVWMDSGFAGGQLGSVRHSFRVTGTPILEILEDETIVYLKDDAGIFWGAGGDASIKYNGSDFLYNSQVVGSGDHIFTGAIITDGNLTVKGGGILLNDAFLRRSATGQINVFESDGVTPGIFGAETGQMNQLVSFDSGVIIFDDTILITEDLSMATDNGNIFFGGSDDASIKYDGSDLLYNSQEVGSGGHIFTGDVRVNNLRIEDNISMDSNSFITIDDIPVIKFTSSKSTGLINFLDQVTFEDNVFMNNDLQIENGTYTPFFVDMSERLTQINFDLEVVNNVTATNFIGNFFGNGEGLTGLSTEKAWTFTSPSGSSGVFYFGGYYDFASSDNDFNPSVSFGTSNAGRGGHISFIANSGATDTEVTVTGTSFLDNGTRTLNDTQVITFSNGSLNAYFETSSKWIGQVTIEKTGGTDRLMNYGWSKYWDNNNNNFTVTGFESTWLGGANDAGADIELIYHSAFNWTYNAGAEPTPPVSIASMERDYSTENEVVNGENGAYKRSNLNTFIHGSNGEGTIIQITTSSNKAFELGNLIVRIQNA